MDSARNKEYLKWIAGLGCIICQAPAVAHHQGKRGMGIKASDFDTIPLCHIHHQEIHQHGSKTFASKYGFEGVSTYENVIRRLNSLWRENGDTT